LQELEEYENESKTDYDDFKKPTVINKKRKPSLIVDVIEMVEPGKMVAKDLTFWILNTILLNDGVDIDIESVKILSQKFLPCLGISLRVKLNIHVLQLCSTLPIKKRV
jgi:hypothetical protein